MNKQKINVGLKFHSIVLNVMYDKKAHMLNIYYSLKTINFLKIKRVVLKHSAPIGIP